MQKKMGKKEWIALFREIGMSDTQMKQWHQAFEKKHPDNHRDFLEWLGVADDEIAQIRAASR